MIDAVTIGETMALVRTQLSGPPKNHEACTLAIGGAESNVAIGLARLGHKVRWISALGQDAFGDLIAQVIADEGVEVIAPRMAGFPTGLMVKSPSSGDQRFVSYYRAGSAASQLKPGDVPLDLISDARLLHITGITPAISESAHQLIRQVAKFAKNSGTTVALDLNYRPKLWDKPRASDAYRNLLSFVDIVFGDQTELNLLLSDERQDAAELLKSVSALGVSEVVLKQGAEGALALANGEIWQRDAVTIEAIDTVGAGDAFVAGYLSAWLDGEDIQARLERGVICGAQACLDAGDWEGAPTREEINAVRRESSR